MKYELTLAGEAQTTIDKQIEWYEADDKRGGSVLALKWVDKLEKVLAKLEDSPHRYGLAPENGRWSPDIVIRQMQFRPWKSGVGWRVLFVIDEPGRIVTVLQVRHERRRWLFETEE